MADKDGDWVDAEPLENNDDEERQPNRRAEDKEQPEKEEGSSTLLSKSRELAGKYGKTIAGLGVAGVALPIAHELDNAHAVHRAEPAPQPATGVNEAQRATPVETGSQTAREDNVGQHWASLKRNNVVKAAISACEI